MAFADLPLDDQLDSVNDALHSLLGDTPSKMDYILLCRATRSIIEALEVAIVTSPLPTWSEPDAQPVIAT
jgi:hypothetical protein